VACLFVSLGFPLGEVGTFPLGRIREITKETITTKKVIARTTKVPNEGKTRDWNKHATKRNSMNFARNSLANKYQKVLIHKKGVDFKHLKFGLTRVARITPKIILNKKHTSSILIPSIKLLLHTKRDK
jgi:hypothetical protein